jgi:acetyl-CoA carboxylase biotin carboxyl carrier protein
MADAPSDAGKLPDIAWVQRLAEVMIQFDLSEIELRQADVRVHLRRGPEIVGTAYVPPGISGAVAQPASRGGGAAAESESAAAAAQDTVELIRSPVVGTFYGSPKPGQPPFVKPGDHVTPETTVCIIEAMKVMNEIPAGISGTIVACLVENEQPVEYGQPLFKVQPAR